MVWTYDPKRVLLLVNLIPVGGFTKDSFITVAMNTPTFKNIQGAYGEFTRVRDPNNGGIITVSLDQASPSNQYLHQLHQLDRKTNTGAFSVYVGYGILGENHVSQAAFIEAPAQSQFSSESGSRVWVFHCANLLMTPTGVGI